MAVADARRHRLSERALHFDSGLGRAAVLDLRIDRRHRREQAGGKCGKNRWPHRRAPLAERELRYLILAAVTLKRIRCRAKRKAIEVETSTRADHRSSPTR